MILRALAPLLAAAFTAAAYPADAPHAKPGAACLPPAKWYALDAPKPRAVDAAQLIADMARRDVVLLGEHHDDRDHHLWQLQTLAALHAARPGMAIGFE